MVQFTLYHNRINMRGALHKQFNGIIAPFFELLEQPRVRVCEWRNEKNRIDAEFHWPCHIACERAERQMRIGGFQNHRHV